MGSIDLQHFFDPQSGTLSYIVYDALSSDALIIDPVLNYDPILSKTNTHSIAPLEDFISKNMLNPLYIMETHAHADHLTGAQFLKRKYPSAKVAIGQNITKVQEKFKGVYNMKDLNTNGIQFDKLFSEGRLYQAGSLSFEVINTPGHTPACLSYLIEDKLFCGDCLFMPDLGTGRCDFPGGSAHDMYHSIHEKLYKLNDQIKVYTGHDYPPQTRSVQCCASLQEHKNSNKMIQADTTLNEFVEKRTKRDQQLTAPKLLLQSIQVNIEAGNFPAYEDNRKRYLKIPIS